MLTLKPVLWSDIHSFFIDFQKKSKCFEMPPETGGLIGIFMEDVMIGYFITQAYDNGNVEINQGYLLPKYRHLNLSKDCTTLLEDICRKAGYKTMYLGTHNRFKAYLKFAKDLGYTPKQLIFSKNLGDK